MITPNIDAGQLIVTAGIGLLAIIGWFIKNQIAELGTRLNNHDNLLLELVRDMGEVKGIVNRRRASNARESNAREY